MAQTQVAKIEPERQSLLVEMASQYHMEPAAFAAAIKATCCPANISNEHFAAFLMVAHEYGLNPLLKEIYAFPRKPEHGGGIQPIVPVDGWVNIINKNPRLNGIEFDDHIDDNKKLTAITARIWRKDREKPTVVTEYMIECVRDTDTWRKWPRRMLRHKALIQCARYAFGLAGIVEPDEADRDVSIMKTVSPDEPPTPPDRAVELVEAGRDDGRMVILGEKEELPIDGPLDEEQWLALLEEQLAACKSFAEASEVQREIMTPEKPRATKQGWKKAEKLIEATVARISSA